MGLLDGKVAVVTGAGRGIGRAIAELFVAEGANVVVNDMDGDVAAEVCAALPGGRAIASVGSVTEPTSTDAMMATAVEQWGHLDILVNNAGITRDRMSHKMTDEQFDSVVAVSLKGTFNCIRSAAPYMRDVAAKEIDDHGEPQTVRKVVNFFSTAAIRGNPGQANYTAAKMGVVGLTRTIAQEWGRYRICCNSVAPGFTQTRMTAAKGPGDATGIPEPIRAAMLQRIPFGRYGQPLDVARVVLFFSSPLSDYVTGQEINVSGGMQIP